MSLYDVYLPKGDPTGASVTVRGDDFAVSEDGKLEIASITEDDDGTRSDLVAIFAAGEWLRVIVREEKS